MNIEQPQSLLNPEVEAQLDQLLVRWQQVRTLQPAQADKIRQAILEVAQELPATYWEYYAKHMNRMMAQVIQRTTARSPSFMVQQWPITTSYRGTSTAAA
jgi:hypothetical protein